MENEVSATPRITKAERRAEKIAARETVQRQEHLKRTVKKVVGWLIVIGLIALGVRAIINQFPKGSDFSRAIEIQGREHIAEGSNHPPYNSNPPTSGWHYPVAANTGFYDYALADEQVVHNLEHGHVWIAYKPNLPAGIIQLLRGFASGTVIVTPRPANETDVALAAWGRLDAFNLKNGEFDRQRIRDFIVRYRNKGPESVTLPVGHRQQ